jgi:hypothetical protein
MLIAASLSVASALLLLSPALSTESMVTMPPLVIGVTVSVDISPSLVPRVLNEAAEIWRATGLTIVWQRDEGAGVRPPPLRVWIGDARGIRSRDRAMPLGWIMFDNAGAPARDIYVSHANALELLGLARSTASIDRMPRAEKEGLIGRAMGRALAHELGHFLLASKEHTAKGLMRARRTSAEFFSSDRTHFDLDPWQRATVLSRYQPGALLAAVGGAPPQFPSEPGTVAAWRLDPSAHSRKFERD